MNDEIYQRLSERGADLVRFVDISELPAEQTMGFNKAIVFLMTLSRQFIRDLLEGSTIYEEFLEKERDAEALADLTLSLCGV